VTIQQVQLDHAGITHTTGGNSAMFDQL
jgi:hypothetical protein